MSNLERIVPPLKLCKQIPEGEFEDSALVWYRFWGEDNVRPRDQWSGFNGERPVPAPTLEEVLEAIGKVENWDTMTMTKITNGKQNITTNALKCWFKVKGIEVEK